ncbi:MAG: MoxR family ATPase [Burkholderiales bacterium]|nr:MoxR family ATPase [Burkholderiales bacterium]
MSLLTAQALAARFRAIVPTWVQRLEKTDQLAESFHQWSARERDALALAAAANRPLLVRGEPGTGKTQLARAAAAHLGWDLEAVTIHARYEPQDLQWRFDAVKRLADASASAANAERLHQHEHDYWEPGPLWKAYGWDTARQYGCCRPAPGQAARAPQGFVVLIDEIDKADADLPNALLEVLGQRSFTIAGLNLPVGGPDRQQPLILITTNEERELPSAFLRRCIVLNLDAGSEGYEAWLQQRGQAHFGAIDAHGVHRSARLEAAVMQVAARQLMSDRRACEGAGLPPPGAAEFLDLLQAVHEMAPGDDQAQLGLLDELSAYAYLKHGAVPGVPALNQSRKPQPVSPDGKPAGAQAAV